MIPLHYLHTGPPSCARFLHCPLQCFSVEVVITKANISFSLCLFFIFLQCSKRLQHKKGWSNTSVDGNPSVAPSIVGLFGAKLMCNDGLVRYPSFSPVIWVKHSLRFMQQRSAWCTTASVLLYVVGLTGWDQRDVCSFMAFFIINIAYNSLAFFFLSHWKYGFIKVDGLLGHILSNVFFSLSFLQAALGWTSLIETGEDLMVRSKRKGRTVRRRRGVIERERGGVRTIPSSPIWHQRVPRVIPPSRACFFRRKKTKRRALPWDIKMGDFDFRGSSDAWGVVRVGPLGLNRENRRYQQAVNNRYGKHARKAVSSQNASRHQITKSISHSVKSHLNPFIRCLLNGQNVYQLL